MSRRQREEIEALKAERDALRASIPGRIDEAVSKARRTHTAQYDDAAGRVIDLERKVKQLEAQVTAQHAAVDHITEMDTPQMRADLEKAGAEYREWREKQGLVTCRVKEAAS